MDNPNETIRVVVAMNFSDDIMEQLREVSPRLHIERYYPNVPEHVWHDAEVLFTVNRFPLPEQAPRLRWIQLYSAGLDNILKEPIIQAEDVEVTTASGVHSIHIAEYCLAMMLAFMYKLPQLMELKAKTEWPENRQMFAPHGLRALTLGIVGYGTIGRELARMADSLGMRVLATKRDVKHPADTSGYQEEGLGDPTGDIPARLYPPQALASMSTLR